MLELDGLAGGKIVVVGIGNTLRGDDGAGSLVADRLAALYPGVVFDAAQAPENYLAPVRRAAPGVVLLVDAADFGGRPGEVRIASIEDVEGSMLGTHAAPLSMFMRILKEDTGADVHLLAIQAVNTGLGEGLSDHVAEAVDGLVSQLTAILEERVEA